jgi:hypothetical protein
VASPSIGANMKSTQGSSGVAERLKAQLHNKLHKTDV